jgi:K+-sensing histidine kinase KdpD
MLDHFIRHWLQDALHRFSDKQLVYDNGTSQGPMTSIAPAALHKILHILVEFALQESPPDDMVDVSLNYDQSQAHIIVQHKAPGLSPADAANLFRLLQPRDLSESGRPRLHRMQLYVASLLAERQHGFLTLRECENNQYKIDLALPLAAQASPD